MTRLEAGRLIEQEYSKAVLKHSPMISFHEGISVLREEFEEAWDEVKKQRADPEALKKELAQVGAMAMRFLTDLL
jgi:NTP pyrophosphatase (non-canonical NTP hydrolase)